MSEVPPSRRLLRGTENPEAVARFERHLLAMRREAVAAARALAEIDACAHWLHEGCSGVAQFGERHGASASEARQLVALARALGTYPGVEDDLTTGRISFQSATTLGRLARRAERYPMVPLNPREWEERARTEPARELSAHVDAWLEEQRIGAAPVAVTAFLSAKGADDLQRAREIASRKEGRALSVGETIEHALDHYLDSFDLARKTPRKRRLPDTRALPLDRYVPAEVRRAVARRQPGCAVPRCPNRIFVERSHRVAHASGGSREADNLDDLCSDHHVMYEQGLLRVEGPTDAPVFYDATGRPITALSEWTFDLADTALADPPEPEENPPT